MARLAILPLAMQILGRIPFHQGAIALSGANINLQATGNITINDITGATPGVTTDGVATLNLGNGGSFSLSSQTGSVNFVDPNTIATTGGAINISGASLLLGNLDTSNGGGTIGNVNLSAINGITVGNIITTGGGYSAGNVNLSAGGDIITNTINSSSTDATGSGTAGSVVATTTGGSITTGAINSSLVKEGGGQFTGTAGAVTLTATDNITVNGGINTSASTTGVDGDTSATGGAVSLSATNNITVNDAINASRSPPDLIQKQPHLAASPYKLTVRTGSTIRFTTINTQAITSAEGTVTGGDVQVLTNGLVQGTGTGTTIATRGIFLDPFSEAGIVSIAGGDVRIQHDGGPDNVPFIVGDATSTNGTAGIIDTGGGTTINAGNFPVLPTGGDASGTPASITITSVNTPPTLTTNTLLSSDASRQSNFKLHIYCQH